MLRAVCLPLLVAGCITTNGRVDVTATTGVWGGALIVGGATVAAGTCQPSAEQCEHVERGDPMFAGTLIVAGAGLLALAYLFHVSDETD